MVSRFPPPVLWSRVFQSRVFSRPHTSCAWLLALWLIEWTTATWCCICMYGTSTACSHTPATDGILNAAARMVLHDSSLAASHCKDTVQECCLDFRLYPRYWSCLPQASHLPSLGFVTSVTHSAAATCSFRRQTRPSASEVSPSRLLSTAMHFHVTSAHCTSVASSSDRS